MNSKTMQQITIQNFVNIILMNSTTFETLDDSNPIERDPNKRLPLSRPINVQIKVQL